MTVVTPTSWSTSWTPAAPVDEEVTRADARYQPRLRGLDDDRSQRLREITRASLDGLEPQVVVNRRVDDATSLLGRGADDPFPTIHTGPLHNAQVAVRRLTRSITERFEGIHGTGANEGRTVFGSVRFVTSEDAREGAASVLAALTRQGSAGVGAYGPISFVVPARNVAPRLTVSADDTGATNARAAPVGKLADVLAERLVRAASGTIPVDELLTMSRDSAINRVRSWLLSDRLSTADSYLEAQVRTLYPRDVAGTVIDRHATAPVRRLVIDPGPGPDDAAVERLTQVLTRAGRAHLVVGDAS